MSYYFVKNLSRSFDDTRTYVEEELMKYGFGVVSEINLHEKFKAKLGIDFRKYKILGACSPKHAHKAISAEEHIGLMLPCNIVLQEISTNETKVSVIDPIASMQSVQNPNLEGTAMEIQNLLQEFVNNL
jgi:uncharacterized protein (DUF302 family)